MKSKTVQKKERKKKSLAAQFPGSSLSHRVRPEPESTRKQPPPPGSGAPLSSLSLPPPPSPRSCSPCPHRTPPTPRARFPGCPLLTPGAPPVVSRSPALFPPQRPTSRLAGPGVAGRPGPPGPRLHRRAAVVGSRPARRAPPARAVRMLPSPTHSGGTLLLPRSHFATEELCNGSAHRLSAKSHRHLCK